MVVNGTAGSSKPPPSAGDVPQNLQSNLGLNKGFEIYWRGAYGSTSALKTIFIYRKKIEKVPW